MPVTYEYYRKLSEESEAFAKKYADMKLWDKYEELKPYDKLYEPVSDSVRFAPQLGRYDRFFHPFEGRKKYHPSRKLFSELPMTNQRAYEYDYKDGQIVCVRIGQRVDLKKNIFSLAHCCHFIFPDVSVQVDLKLKVLDYIRLIKRLDHSTRYLSVTPRSEFFAPRIEEFIVYDDGQGFDFYENHYGLCCHQHCNKKEYIDCEDSKYIVVSEASEDETIIRMMESVGFQRIE